MDERTDHPQSIHQSVSMLLLVHHEARAFHRLFLPLLGVAVVVACVEEDVSVGLQHVCEGGLQHQQRVGDEATSAVCGRRGGGGASSLNHLHLVCGGSNAVLDLMGRAGERGMLRCCRRLQRQKLEAADVARSTLPP